MHETLETTQPSDAAFRDATCQLLLHVKKQDRSSPLMSSFLPTSPRLASSSLSTTSLSLDLFVPLVGY